MRYSLCEQIAWNTLGIELGYASVNTCSRPSGYIRQSKWADCMSKKRNLQSTGVLFIENSSCISHIAPFKSSGRVVNVLISHFIQACLHVWSKQHGVVYWTVRLMHLLLNLGIWTVAISEMQCLMSRLYEILALAWLLGMSLGELFQWAQSLCI